MSVRKLLYVTNLEDKALSFKLLKGILPLRQLGLEEILFLQTTTFDAWIKELSGFEIKSRVLVEKKLVLSRILSVAEEEGVSLIVINLDRSVGKSHDGSIIGKLIKRSSLPLLFVNNIDQMKEPDENGFFSHVVFPTDWSPASEKAFRYLLDFKDILGEMEIVNVIIGKLTVKDMRELKERLAQTRKRCLDVEIDAESHIYAGNVSKEILTAARDYKASIIFLGGMSEGLTIKKIFKGSSSCRVAEKANLPVLVTP